MSSASPGQHDQQSTTDPQARDIGQSLTARWSVVDEWLAQAVVIGSVERTVLTAMRGRQGIRAAAGLAGAGVSPGVQLRLLQQQSLAAITAHTRWLDRWSPRALDWLEQLSMTDSRRWPAASIVRSTTAEALAERADWPAGWALQHATTESQHTRDQNLGSTIAAARDLWTLVAAADEAMRPHRESGSHRESPSVPTMLWSPAEQQAGWIAAVGYGLARMVTVPGDGAMLARRLAELPGAPTLWRTVIAETFTDRRRYRSFNSVTARSKPTGAGIVGTVPTLRPALLVGALDRFFSAMNSPARWEIVPTEDPGAVTSPLRRLQGQLQVEAADLRSQLLQRVMTKLAGQNAEEWQIAVQRWTSAAIMRRFDRAEPLAGPHGLSGSRSERLVDDEFAGAGDRPRSDMAPTGDRPLAAPMREVP